MIADYLKFDAERFVENTYEKMKMLPSMKQSLKDLDGQKGIDTTKDKVQESPNLDAIHNVAMLRIRLEGQIEDAEKDIQKLKKAMATLSEEEREAIDICFCGKNIKAQCLDNHVEERTIYNRRNRALSKIEKAVIG